MLRYSGRRTEILGKNIFELWEEGAKELEKTAPGKLITAPIRLPEAVFTSAQKTVTALPNVMKAVPWVLIILAVGVGGYLIFAGRKGTDLTKMIPFKR
jgi:hypothetical protein